MSFCVLAFRETTWLDRNTDHQQWSHLVRAYGGILILEEWEKWDPANLPDNVDIVVLDETGDTALEDFEHPENCCYVFGKTYLNQLQNKIPCQHSVRIETPIKICLFGVTAGAIVLADRVRKQ